MSKKPVFLTVLVTILVGALSASFNIHKVEAPYPIIYIRADGSIDPSTANITSLDNVVYGFKADISAEIRIERSHIVINGNGYTLNGSGSIMYGFNLTSVSNVTIRNLKVMGFEQGIYLWHCNNITISENNITGNSYNGIYLLYSDENSILNNEFYSNSDAGIRLSASSDNTIQKNTNFFGYGSQYGIVLWEYSDRNTVSDNVLSPYFCGIAMGYSSGNHILNNTVSNTMFEGVDIQQICNNSVVANNVVFDCGTGISIKSESEATRYNVIKGNDVMHNLNGIYIDNLGGSIIYQNNFIDNTKQTSISSSTNIWNKGYPSGGNYWSNYSGVDSDSDGIGDTPHVIDANNADYYPLIGAFHSYNTTLGLPVNVISNSTIESFQYFESNSTVKMYVSNMSLNQIYGFCRICIPKSLISPPYSIVIDNGSTEVLYFNDTVYDNGTHRWIYFAYEHSTREIVITPEFPWLTILPLFVIATLIAITRRKKTTL